MSAFFLNKEFISKEFAPHISFDMVYNVRLVCKAWSNLVNTHTYTQSVISSPPTQQELEEYKRNGGSLKFNCQVRLTITRGRYYLVENFMTEDEFEYLYLEEIFGVYKPYKIHELDLISKKKLYNEELIKQTVQTTLNIFELSNSTDKKIIFVDIVLFFLITPWGMKFMG